ncbi:MAG TPA: endonuclease III, partial [Candidatus Avimonas sp.]|nr:endonuclease III [Candidatus Avimonas sp.]
MGKKVEVKTSEKIDKILEILKGMYPEAKCSLDYNNPFQLLVATRLSAQCTDARVNMVTPALFERYQAVEDFAQADLSELESYIRSCGLYKTKARDIKAMAQKVIE